MHPKPRITGIHLPWRNPTQNQHSHAMPTYIPTHRRCHKPVSSNHPKRRVTGIHLPLRNPTQNRHCHSMPTYIPTRRRCHIKSCHPQGDSQNIINTCRPQAKSKHWDPQSLPPPPLLGEVTTYYYIWGSHPTKPVTAQVLS